MLATPVLQESVSPGLPHIYRVDTHFQTVGIQPLNQRPRGERVLMLTPVCQSIPAPQGKSLDINIRRVLAGAQQKEHCSPTRVLFLSLLGHFRLRTKNWLKGPGIAQMAKAASQKNPAHTSPSCWIVQADSEDSSEPNGSPRRGTAGRITAEGPVSPITMASLHAALLHSWLLRHLQPGLLPPDISVHGHPEKKAPAKRRRVLLTHPRGGCWLRTSHHLSNEMAWKVKILDWDLGERSSVPGSATDSLCALKQVVQLHCTSVSPSVKWS